MWKTTSCVLLALASCSSPSKPHVAHGSRGPRADEHVDAAHVHARRAAALRRWLDAGKPAESGLWYQAWQTAKDHERETEVHLAAAADLQATFERACAGVPASEVGTSPIGRHALAALPTHDGAVVLLSPDAGPAERLADAMRCHRAWMMLGSKLMADCPLDLAGVDVVAYGDHAGVSVELSIDDPTLVPELQKRAADVVARGAHKR
jgi:hypothetical protein